jgi:hypothetical protein
MKLDTQSHIPNISRYGTGQICIPQERTIEQDNRNRNTKPTFDSQNFMKEAI